LLLPGILIAFLSSYGQEELDLSIKTIRADRMVETPVIDGTLDPGIWEKLPLATGFVQYNPYNGVKPSHETEIRFGYNETGLYVGAFMHDPNPDSIFTELGKRDQIDELNTDYLSVDILPHNDGLTMFEFKITPKGLQSDNKYSAAGKESSWDAVWYTGTAITDSGWVAEFFIPYSALRFPKTAVQTWGINMWRRMGRNNEMSTWSWVPNDRFEIFRYYGTLVGMEGIKPPLRLSFTPYLGGYLEKRPGEERWDNFVRGGMDLKLGLSQSFTLDMELVPDFGQVQSDDIILNLTPFEIRYDERRQFFTEGTEMFEKCDIFYSRRVGTTPRGYGDAYDSLYPQEKITKNPELTQVINATKISGRNRNGLGIGVFNGMTTNTWAEAKDTLEGTTRRISTQPFTNYNVLVFDQNLKNQSYVTLINTNYWTPDWKYNANVTGAETKLLNEANTFAFKGLLNVSQIYDSPGKANLGYTSLLNIYKPGGTWRYSLLSKVLDENYDPNDMGYLDRNNEIRNMGSLSYNIYQPVWKILNSSTRFEAMQFSRYMPYELIMWEFDLFHSTRWRNFWESELTFGYRPWGSYDYYEPRVEGWYYHQPPSWGAGIEIHTDTRKKLACEVETGAIYHPENRRLEYLFELGPRYRISDRFTTGLFSTWDLFWNDYGWVETAFESLPGPVIYFGRRDVVTVDNVLELRYVFTKDLSMNLRARHYWSRVNYLDYYTLRDDGELDPADYEDNKDIDFNAFNVDLQFLWFFAPGSQMSLVWKNNILTMGDTPSENYFRAFEKTLEAPQTNSISLRVLYYLDYTYIRNVFSKRKNSS